jgi:hypothetical protein
MVQQDQSNIEEEDKNKDMDIKKEEAKSGDINKDLSMEKSKEEVKVSDLTGHDEKSASKDLSVGTGHWT